MSSATSVSFVSATTPNIVELSDSASWSGDVNKMETVGAETKLFGETFTVYTGLKVENQLLQFNLSFELDDGWVGLKFRSNLPYNAPWDNKTGYLFLLQPTAVQLIRQGTMKTLATINFPNGINLSDGQYHKIVTGVYNQVGLTGVVAVLKIDDIDVMSYEDNDKENMSLGSSIFSIFQFGANTSTKIMVNQSSNSTVKGIVSKNAPATNNSISENGKFAINNVIGMSQDYGYKMTMHNNNGVITTKGKGGISYSDLITANAYSFDIQMKELTDSDNTNLLPGSTVVMFRKQDRNTISGNNGYGIRFSKNGTFSLVSYNNDKAKVFPAYKTDFDFTQKHSITVEVVGDISGEKWFSNIYIYIDSKTKAYQYTDTSYNPNLESPSFIGLLNTNYNVETTISNIKFDGYSEHYKEDILPYPIYFADVFVENNKPFLHWVWRPDGTNYTKSVIETLDGKKLGETNYPFDTFSLEGLNGYDKLIISAENIDKKRSAPVVVDLSLKASDLYSTTNEKIVIKPGEKNAGFFTKDSNKPFVPNGVNYINIRFGDHANFESSYGLLPAKYDPYAAETLMRTLKKNNYNFIRVFVIPGGRQSQNLGLGGVALETEGLYIPYMENFVDFLSRAKKYGIYIMPTFGENEMVANSFFSKLSGNSKGQSILFSKLGIDAKKQMIKWFLEYIKTKDSTLLNSIFALQMQNEFTFNSQLAPFNQTTGEYSFIDGTKFNMADDTSRRELANSAIKNYYKEMKSAATSVVGEMLISEGTFSMLAVGKNMTTAKGIRTISGTKDTRFPMSAEEYLDTDIDFLDLHVYRYGQSGTAEQVFQKNIDNMLFNSTKSSQIRKYKPIILGEYGAIANEPQERDFDDGMAFAKGLRDSAIKSGFAGVAIWTIDTFEQTDIWCLMWENGKYLSQMSLLNNEGAFSSILHSEIHLKNYLFSNPLEKLAMDINASKAKILKNNWFSIPLIILLMLIIVITTMFLSGKKIFLARRR
jgi:hypothetical protein